MNLGSKGKKRVVLPSRPEPPTVEQILEDMQSSASDDPLFTLDQADPGWGASLDDTEVELRFSQCRRFMELNQRLKEAQERLEEQREELSRTKDGLQRDIQEVKAQTLQTASS